MTTNRMTIRIGGGAGDGVESSGSGSCQAITMGVFYRTEDVPSYEEQVVALKTGAPAMRSLEKLRPDQIEALLAEAI